MLSRACLAAIVAVLATSPAAAQRTGGSIGGRSWGTGASSSPAARAPSAAPSSSGLRYTGPIGATRDANGRPAPGRHRHDDDDGPTYVVGSGEGSDFAFLVREASGSPACGFACIGLLVALLALLVHVKNNDPPKWMR